MSSEFEVVSFNQKSNVLSSDGGITVIREFPVFRKIERLEILLVIEKPSNVVLVIWLRRHNYVFWRRYKRRQIVTFAVDNAKNNNYTFYCS